MFTGERFKFWAAGHCVCHLWSCGGAAREHKQKEIGGDPRQGGDENIYTDNSNNVVGDENIVKINSNINDEDDSNINFEEDNNTNRFSDDNNNQDATT